ncbi:MAG: carboxylesterase family protein, partial [Myxococcota bacterium]
MLRVLWLFIVLVSCTARAPSAEPVRVTEGLAHGVTKRGITSWLGLEYARAERWRLPTAGPSWDGVRTLDTPGPACPQPGQAVMVEDCLFLNVFAPEGPTAVRKPVLVWIHGGGFRNGEGGVAMGQLVRQGIVVVTFNYRLGLLGFRDWPGWGPEDPRNFGQADMVAALQWVSANIAAFGGDPDNVTIAGHSAGGMGVQLMMVDPRARGLFHRAIAHAGYGTWPFPRAMNPSEEARASLRIAPLEHDATAAELVARVKHYHLPVRGGADLPEQPVDAFEAGRQAPVPYLAGANSYDGHDTIY